MKVLVIGSGGREHALAWKISRSKLVKKIYAAPGNAGISNIAECVNIKADDIDKLCDFAKKEGIGLTVVGPEAPLMNGIVDRFQEEGLKIFGPSKLAAELEGSKVFCKDLLRKHAIPSAAYKAFDNPKDAREYIRQVGMPLVIKADGLAAGKGVVVCLHPEIAEKTIHNIMDEKAFGPAGDKVIIEECLTGKELSVLAISDGETIAVLEPAQDYKRVFDGDKGPNTGGMGSYSPVPFVTDKIMDNVIGEILVPTIHAMKSKDRTYQGVLYAGLMLTPKGIKVLEFNVRFGDPETQPLMMRLKSDIVEVMLAVAEKRLDKLEPLEWHNDAAACVIMASKGYPGSYETSLPITGLDKVKTNDTLQVFHAGTALKDNQVLTNGGRVLSVTALGKDITAARKKAYDSIGLINFDGAFYRKDIGLPH
ncbi:MAG: phosphoribosylamine--glycine ligase [Planctomycetota bacterium]